MKKSDKIKKWIKEAIKRGYSDEDINNLLSQSGYEDYEIKEILEICDSLKVSDKSKTKKSKEEKITYRKGLKHDPISKEIVEVSELLSEIAF